MTAKVSGTRQKWGWAMYDWANSAFATTVMAGFFPVFFKEYWNSGVDAATSTFRLGMANSLASLLIVLLAPLLGAIADCMSRRKAMLFSFAFLGVLMTAGLYLIGEGDWFLAAFLYVLALIGFSGSNVFYDSLLPFVSRKDKIDQTSALGFSMGYLGGGILLSINVLMALHPEKFGLADGAAAIRISFLMVAAWWLIFSLPLMLLVEEPDGSASGWSVNVLQAGFKRVWTTLQEVRQLRNIWLFLVAYWLYIDGVDTIVRMAVDYGLSLGFDQNSLITALLITQFTGFPAAIAFGWFGGRYGPKTGIFIGLAVYIVVTVWASVMDSVSEFYYLAFSAEFFGFYNMLGKFAAILGPVMIGWVGVISGNPRTGILSLLVLFVVGGFILTKVNVPDSKEIPVR